MIIQEDVLKRMGKFNKGGRVYGGEKSAAITTQREQVEIGW
jgi:hypothetical protein